MASQQSMQQQGQEREGNQSTNSNIIIDDAIGLDLLQNILSRLPASAFASAACVSSSWNSICSRILSSPKLSSSLSLNPSLHDAVNEVLEKVLSEPIRPQFATVSMGPCPLSSLVLAHNLISERLGSGVPVITSLCDGIMGRDAFTGEFKEVQWDIAEDEDDIDSNGNTLPNRGILLTIGYLPGLKANLIPMWFVNEEATDLMIDEFVMDIREYTYSVSGSISPAAIILFADVKNDIRPVLRQMDYAFSLETVIVGEGVGRCLYKSDWERNNIARPEHNPSIVALLFVKDKDMPPGIGETQFHVTLSNGIQPVGATYMAASVREKYRERSTWLTARRDEIPGYLDGQAILDDIYNKIGDNIRHQALYIGVKKRRKCTMGLKEVKELRFLEFHEVIGGDDEYLYVNDNGIQTGDSFRFYISDSNAALCSCNKIFDHFKCLKKDYENICNQKIIGGVAANGSKKSVFGGFIFSCLCRDESFFGCSNVDSMPFLENFPEVTLAGTFCAGEIKRGDIGFYEQKLGEEGHERCCLHVFSTVYLVLTYIPV